jgi:isopenicillin-N epimerase
MTANPIWGDDWQSVRDLWRLDPEVAHCNHGSFGAVPGPVLDLQNELRARMAANPMAWFSREMPSLVTEARAEVAAFLGADPADVAFVTNVSAGVSAVTESLQLGPDDEIVSTSHIYGAVGYALERMSERSGARRVVVDIAFDAGDEVVAESVCEAISDRCALVVIDQITSGSARRFPIAPVIAAAHEAGAAVLVDGAHAPGMLPLELPALGADFWTGNLHKWACTPAGTGVLWVAPRWQKEMRSLTVSWAEHEGFPLSFERVGTNDLSAWLAAPAALRLLGGLGWERLRSHNARLAAWAQSCVAERLGTAGDGLRHDPGLSMAVVRLPPEVRSEERARALQAHLAAGGVEAAVGFRGPEETGFGTVRLSAQAYNRPADYERLADGVVEFLGLSRGRAAPRS